jgi:hypothetical protein
LNYPGPWRLPPDVLPMALARYYGDLYWQTKGFAPDPYGFYTDPRSLYPSSQIAPTRPPPPPPPRPEETDYMPFDPYAPLKEALQGKEGTTKAPARFAQPVIHDVVPWAPPAIYPDLRFGPTQPITTDYRNFPYEMI